ncbi:ubiquitin-conjugating enzyme/RWD-like protein [Pisolithus marmoratus]|nr:ubiquitin-conjugating enzyme/RWD-like protein [Pisolithus marmoratus]
MTDSRLRRVNKEIIACIRDETCHFTVDLVDSSPFHLKCSIPGPKGTPYENGIFEVDVVYPESYPFHPLQVKFITKVYHPNISAVSGVISLDILQEGWWPGFTIKTVLLSVQALLSSPEPSDSLETEALQHYIADKCSFEETARYWTRIYAGGPERLGADNPITSHVDDVALAGLEKTHVDRYEAFGFQPSKVIDILRQLNYRGSNVAIVPDEVVIEELLK